LNRPRSFFDCAIDDNIAIIVPDDNITLIYRWARCLGVALVLFYLYAKRELEVNMLAVGTRLIAMSLLGVKLTPYDVRYPL